MARKSRFKIIHPADDYEATFASAEDVIVRKLQFYSRGGSDKHLRDIAGVLQLSSEQIDREYVTEWADGLDLRAIWDRLLASF